MCYGAVAEDILQVVFFTVWCFNWSEKKHCVAAKVSLAVREIFLNENIWNYDF